MTIYEARRLLGFRMKRLRELAGVPADLAARKLGISEPHLAGVEAGQLSIDVSQLFTAATLYRCHPFFLLDKTVPASKGMNVPPTIRQLARLLHSLKAVVSILPLLEPMLRTVADLDHLLAVAKECTTDTPSPEVP